MRLTRREGLPGKRAALAAASRTLGAALLAATSAGCASHSHQPEIALTFDDLPVHAPFPPGQTPQSVGHSIIGALKDAHVPAYGFVNGHWLSEQKGSVEVLKEWRSAGLLLGNHGWTHRHLGEMTTSEFEQEVATGEPVLQKLASGTDWRWFRYPFLDEGSSAEKRQAARDVLARRGYKIADVTMDFGDWQWTAPYARCLASSDKASVQHLEQLYLAAAREAIDHYRTLSRKLYGRDIPYVILLHESAFEARMLPRLIDLYRGRGFRFVSLPDAERDTYYRDRVRPGLEAQPAGLDARALAGGIRPPSRTDYGIELAAICTGT